MTEEDVRRIVREELELYDKRRRTEDVTEPGNSPNHMAAHERLIAAIEQQLNETDMYKLDEESLADLEETMALESDWLQKAGTIMACLFIPRTLPE